ncbi:hypothetical protein [Natrinema sp. SYSU A 869]|uniref:hypothetical protein n=1 Tax=Natrinema sp. SYSU A 869 TaxID=2871694 RepID=UPI001CA3F655|nr:hypothetical protein [Natrinema sp. SYSU A 869]
MSRETTTESAVNSSPEGGRHQQPKRERPVSDVLSDEQNKSYLTYITLLFAIVGVGYGLTGALGIRMLFEESADAGLAIGFFLIVLFGVMVFTGPILGAISGLQLQRHMTDTREALITAFVSGTIGYVAMTVVSVLVTVLLIPSTDSADTSSGGGSDLFELGEIFVPLIVMAIPVGLVAAGMIYLDDKFLA